MPLPPVSFRRPDALAGPRGNNPWIPGYRGYKKDARRPPCTQTFHLRLAAGACPRRQGQSVCHSLSSTAKGQEQLRGFVLRPFKSCAVRPSFVLGLTILSLPCCCFLQDLLWTASHLSFEWPLILQPTMFSRRPDTSSKSFSKSHGKASKSSSSFGRDSGVSKRRHQPRHRRPATASMAAGAENTLISKSVAVS